MLPLLDVLMRRRTPVSVLIDDVLKAVSGTSLRGADNDLYPRVNALLDRRNKIAHKGDLPDKETAKAGVLAAREVIVWLRSLAAKEHRG